ncbi:hypothetical protein SS1G_05453 [Sclerotinia sclerotiorum 1980 UF-70]|uniref:LysM domain-containing protein n=1 Tax=Sclerotinia sclerotiorum (strain ATCC 18683 / 1980 / Ss-1) TaxID=665079 RepID=A7EJG0_SCLS1|nr:hypothetical protein SS1G_05453 [Sclerotinia sclerotiorum 1980 UF-70]EDO02976.1 hypothetical protein SS1G_05453 [Sclerotinia sclerotiorum 1980 UF-70]
MTSKNKYRLNFTNVNCARQIKGFLPGTYKSIEVLERACTNDCSISLAKYQKATEVACGEHDSFPISENREAPVSFIPQIMFYNFNRTCIKDEGRWCNIVHKGFAEINTINPMAELVLDKETKPGSNKKRQTAVDICDNCVIKQLQFQAGSPINDGFLLQSKYSSLTARCSKTGMPLGTSTTPFPVQPIPTSPAGNCTGHRYTLQAGDTCRSISKSQGVGTAWLLYDNNLAAFCAGFPTNGTLCIQNRCSVYTVQVNDTCLGIAGARNLSQIQLNTWNPILGDLCRSINLSVGDSICVSPPGEPNYTVPTITAPPTSGPSTTAAPVPTPLAPGTTDYCAQYHLTEKGEYCNLLVVKFSIALEDFLFLNPHVNAKNPSLQVNSTDCAPEAGQRYCMAQWNGASFAQTKTIATSTPLPVRDGVTPDCKDYSSVNAGITCQNILDRNSITIEQFYAWNPAVGPKCGNLWSGETYILGRNHDCKGRLIDIGYRYCIRVDDVPVDPEESTSSSTTTSKSISTTSTATSSASSSKATAPAPTQDGIAPTSGDGLFCYDISVKYGITLEQFFAW